MPGQSGSSFRTALFGWILLAVAFILVIVIALAYWFAVTNSQLSGWQERGQFGDTFGALNALFSGLAFTGVIVTIFLQTKELGLQRQELEETRQVLREQVYFAALSASIAADSAFLQAFPGTVGAESASIRLGANRTELDRLVAVTAVRANPE